MAKIKQALCDVAARHQQTTQEAKSLLERRCGTICVTARIGAYPDILLSQSSSTVRLSLDEVGLLIAALKDMVDDAEASS